MNFWRISPFAKVQLKRSIIYIYKLKLSCSRYLYHVPYIGNSVMKSGNAKACLMPVEYLRYVGSQHTNFSYFCINRIAFHGGKSQISAQVADNFEICADQRGKTDKNVI